MSRTPGSASRADFPGRRRRGPWCALRVKRALLVGLVLLAAAQVGAAEPTDVVVSRNLYVGTADRAEAALAAGTAVELRHRRWRVAGVTRLRITSPDPTSGVVLRFRERPGSPGRLVLTVILVNDPGRQYRYHVQSRSQTMQGGELAPLTRYRVGAGLETELRGKPGAVERITIQDDAAAELRLSRDGEVLTLAVIPAQYGGEPSGGTRPYYQGRPLPFQNYRLRGAGWYDSDTQEVSKAYGDVRILEDFALTFNGFFKTGESLMLARAVARQQLTRWERMSLWLEGGGAAYQLVKETGVTDPATLTWVFGATAHYRRGDWGTALHVSTVNGPLLTMLLGSWQAWRHVGVLLLWHSFQGSSDLGAGLSFDF